MSTVLFSRYLSSSVIVMVLLSSLDVISTSTAAAAKVLESTETVFDKLMHQADDLHKGGKFAESADRYAKAYRSCTLAERAQLAGEIAFNNADRDYSLADEQDQDNDNLELLEAWAGLIDEFLQDRSAGSRAGEADPALSDMRDKLIALRERIDILRSAVIDVRGPHDTGQGTPPPGPPLKPNHKIGTALVSVGLGVVVGGVALVGTGVSNFSKINVLENRQQMAVQDAHNDETSDYTEEQLQAYQDDLDAWVRENRGVATGLVVGGAVLATVGISLTVWGAVRLRKGRSGQRAAIRATPMLGKNRGLVLSVAF